MKLKELQAKGAQVDGGLVKKPIVWNRKDEDSGEELSDTFDIFVLRQSFGNITEIMQNDGAGYSRAAGMIAACVRLGDSGEEVMTYDDAYRLEPSLAGAMLTAVNEVNKSKAKNSPQMTSSGTS